MIRLAWAAALLATPATVLEVLGSPVDSNAVTVARILGARHAAQGFVEVASWPRWRRAGSLIDGAHSLSAVALGVMAPRWRRAGLADSGVAAAFAIAGWA